MGARNIACKCRSAGQAISPVAGAAPFEAVLIDSGEARCPVRSPAGARASGRVGCRAARRRSGSSFRRFRQDHPHACGKRRSGDLARLCPQRCSASRPYGVACRILDLLRAEPDRDFRVVHDQPGREQRPHQASLRRWNRYEHPMATCDLGAQHRVRRRVSPRRRVADRLRCEQHLGGYGRWLKAIGRRPAGTTASATSVTPSAPGEPESLSRESWAASTTSPTATEEEVGRATLGLLHATSEYIGLAFVVEPDGDEAKVRALLRLEPNGWWGRLADRPG